ncbi:hypothetical protein, partial [uncultured Sphingomonas sp.]|uniref:hypothetical protein n=1 Tax=uncultured Sphingomonas sp. TaxID=158754 RepID=UPI0025FDFDC7
HAVAVERHPDARHRRTRSGQHHQQHHHSPSSRSIARPKKTIDLIVHNGNLPAHAAAHEQRPEEDRHDHPAAPV